MRNGKTKKISRISVMALMTLSLMPWTAAAQETVKTATEFQYTGDVQTWTAPQTGTYRLETWGAQGGANTSRYEVSGGLGGYASGELTLNEGEELYVYVGGKGTDSFENIDGSCESIYAGGWNGGGDGGGTAGPGGGGGSDIRKGSTEISDRIIVAGGGGGGVDPAYYMGDIYELGSNNGGNGNYLYEEYAGQSGTIGLFGSYCSDTAGGGGGYWGGQSISGDDPVSAFGGSNFVGSLYNTSSLSGTQAGNGMARITLLDGLVADLSKITINERMLSLNVGGGTQLVVTAYYSNGSTRDITNLVTYRTSNTNILSVDGTGYVSGINRGTADISITYSEKTSTGKTKLVSSRVRGTVY